MLATSNFSTPSAKLIESMSSSVRGSARTCATRNTGDEATRRRRRGVMRGRVDSERPQDSDQTARSFNPSFRLPEPISLEIERDVAEADRGTRGLSPGDAGSSARAISSRADFEPRDVAVMTHAARRGIRAREPPLRPARSRAASLRSLPIVRMRDDRHADAGSSQVGRPASCDSSRMSAFVSPASSSGLMTPNSRAARRPGR